MSHFHIIAHTHWDREWHKTFQENRVRLIPFMDDLMTQIRNKENFIFTLDGQTSLIEDYLEVKPENKELLKKAFGTKRLIPGPWYVQPDTFIPSFESLVRNLLISRRIASSYAEQLNTGYLPDSFGQSAVVPTLLRGFGMNTALIYRGVSDEDTKHNEFNWEGIDGSNITTVWMPKGYGNAMFLSTDLEKSKKVIDENVELLNNRSISDNFLLMSGSDQCFAKSHLTKVKDMLDKHYKNDAFYLTTIDQYMDTIIKHNHKLETLFGELRKGKFSRVHASIAGTRGDIKKENHEIERLYESVLEPLNVLLYLNHGEPNHDIIQKGWKYIVENHAHDSICTVCTDTVHREIRMRIEYARQIANTLIDNHMDKLHEVIRYDHHEGRPVIVFNGTLANGYSLVQFTVYTKEKDFDLYNKKGEVFVFDILNQTTINLKDTKVSLSPIPDDYYYKTRIKTLVDVEGIGYQTLYIKEGQKPLGRESSMIRDSSFENEHISVIFKDNGLVDVKDLKTDKIHKDQLEFIDGGNAGDEYDYSPAKSDTLISSKNKLVSKKIIKDTPLEAVMELKHSMAIPLTTSLEKRSQQMVDINLVTEVSLYKNAQHVNFNTTVDNQAYNHRLQVRFKTDDVQKHHVSDTQLGRILRENIFEETEKSIKEGWSERYYPVFNQHRFTGFNNCDAPFFVLNKGVPQYDITQTDVQTKLNITLLSAVGMMGNENLPYRPGRRSGAVCETPDAQMTGPHTFEYAFMPYRDDSNLENIATLYTNPPLIRSYAEYDTEGSWPDTLNLMRSKLLSGSVLKVAENKKATILRIKNPYIETLALPTIHFNKHLFKHIVSVDLKEDPLNDSKLKIHSLNTVDESNKPRLAGSLQWENIIHNQPKTLSFKTH